jgi:hypothetical protein
VTTFAHVTFARVTSTMRIPRPACTMETTEAVPTDVSVLLSADVHQDQANFTEIVRDLIDSTNVKPSEEIVRDRVELLLSTVGRNLLKLHGLVQVVYAEISSGSPWARSVGVRFYR